MAITDFRGEHRWLSNFGYGPFWYKGIRWETSEAAYQAMKSLSRRVWLQVSELKTPREAKAAGYKLEIRKDWEEIKLQVMYEIVLAKFSQNPDLAERLLATGSEQLVEGNTWGDTFWGVCGGKGENHLGKILMRVRAALVPAQRWSLSTGEPLHTYWARPKFVSMTDEGTDEALEWYQDQFNQWYSVNPKWGVGDGTPWHSWKTETQDVPDQIVRIVKEAKDA